MGLARWAITYLWYNLRYGYRDTQKRPVRMPETNAKVVEQGQ
jgi:hypothetical protein